MTVLPPPHLPFGPADADAFIDDHSQPCTFLSPDQKAVPVARIFFKEKALNPSEVRKTQHEVLTAFDFDIGQKANAVLWDIALRGHVVKYYAPAAGKPPPHTHWVSMEQVVNALCLVPPTILAATSRIVVTPAANALEHEAGRRGQKFRADAAADSKLATMWIYPLIERPTQKMVDRLVLHECVHNFVHQWLDVPENAARWSAAIAADPTYPSSMAMVAATSKKEDIGDDITEFLMMYLQGKGSFCDDDLRDRFPHRYDLAADVLAPK